MSLADWMRKHRIAQSKDAAAASKDELESAMREQEAIQAIQKALDGIKGLTPAERRNALSVLSMHAMATHYLKPTT